MGNIIKITHKDCEFANDDFAKLMSTTEKILNAEAKIKPSDFNKLSASDLENVSVYFIQKACNNSPFDPNSVKLISGQNFPDIIVEKHYGVEVKSTIKNGWISTGSSILESTRIDGIERIYMLFGKLGGTIPEFRCRPYQSVLYDVALTHAPRYLINMELGEHESIFDKMGIQYDVLRKSDNPIDLVRKYYQQKAKDNIAGTSSMPWWITTQSIETPMSFNIRTWNILDDKEQNDLQAQGLILFREILSPAPSRTKYNRMSLWLCACHQVVIPNIRDIFTAGGKVNEINGIQLKTKVPKLFYHIFRLLTLIKDILNSPDENFISQIREFNPEILTNNDYFGNWLKQLTEHTQSLGISHLQ